MKTYLRLYAGSGALLSYVTAFFVLAIVLLAESAATLWHLSWWLAQGILVGGLLVLAWRWGRERRTGAVLRVGQGSAELLRQLAEAERARATLTGVLEAVGSSIFIADRHGEILWVNRAFTTITGYSPGEAIGEHARLLSSSREDAAFHRQIWNTVREGGIWRGELTGLRKDGAEYIDKRVVSALHDGHGKILGIVSVSEDVTVQRHAEIALYEERARVLGMVESTPDLVWEVDLEHRFTWVSEQSRAMLGYAPAELIGRKRSGLSRPDERARRDQRFRSLSRTGVAVRSHESTVLHRDGRAVMIDSSAAPIYGRHGELTGYRGVDRDITERKRAEDSLRQSMALTRSIMDSLESPIAVLDADGVIIHVNRAWTDAAILSGTDQMDRVGLGVNYFEVCRRAAPDPVAKAVLDGMGAVLSGVQTSFTLEYPCQRPDRMTWCVLKVTPLVGEARGLVACHIDITDAREAELARQQLERRLQVSQKMDALGQLTGGIAHDFNNILGAMLGYASLALKRVESGVGAGNALDQDMLDQKARLGDDLTEIMRSGERGRDLIAKMLAYARGQTAVVTESVLVEPLVREVTGMLGSMVPPGVRVQTLVASGAPDTPVAIRMAAVDLLQVLMNLAINARDAVGVSGVVEINLRGDIAVQGRCALCLHDVDGRYVVVDVVDSGAGIPAALQTRIFDPFFTTRDVGKGTGLGLSVVHGIVTKAGGHVLVDSVPGRTRFRLCLPVAADAPPVPDLGATSAAVAAPAAGQVGQVGPDAPASARIWIVDDEETLGRYLAELLGGEGYAVTVFNRPSLLLDAFRADPDAVDLVITDQTMPGMSGKQLAALLSQARPELPILLCSGYNEPVDAAEATRQGLRAILAKPVDATVLLATIARVLA